MSCSRGLPREVDLREGAGQDGAALARMIVAARLVCFPTDTVYGVGGQVRPDVASAVVAAKGRDDGKPLQVVFPSLDMLLELGPWTFHVTRAMRRLLPGPYTVLLPYPASLDYPPPGKVTWDEPGGDARTVSTCGVRAPLWPAGAAALGRLPFPLLASSANPSGGRAPRSLDEIDPELLAACDLVLDAGPLPGLASTVLDLSVYEETGRWRILREGAAQTGDVAALLAGEHPGAAGPEA